MRGRGSSDRSSAKTKGRIYPVFLPHLGCEFRCVYCNQHVTSRRLPFPERADELLPMVLNDVHARARGAHSSGKPGEIAFYGGTFTGLPTLFMEQILDAASQYVREGLFTGIRFSTRPDRMTSTICSVLESFPVQTVELGVQSLCEKVLLQSRRGYGVDEVLTAAKRVRTSGWKLGFQLMLGLPGEDLDCFLQTVTHTVSLRPDFVRIYPLLVLTGTTLARWYREGLYRPLALEDAILWSACAYERFRDAGIQVIRMGLHPDPELTSPGNILAGPFHPAFGYLVRVQWWRERVDEFLQSLSVRWTGADLVLHVGDRSMGEVVGPNRRNLLYWQDRWRVGRIRVRPEKHLQQEEFQLVPEDRDLPLFEVERTVS